MTSRRFARRIILGKGLARPVARAGHRILGEGQESETAGSEAQGGGGFGPRNGFGYAGKDAITLKQEVAEFLARVVCHRSAFYSSGLSQARRAASRRPQARG